MAVLHSWPLASDPSHLARLDNRRCGAQYLGRRRGWRTPCRAIRCDLFEAPIFYPEHHSLAFSEHMFVPVGDGRAALWSGVSPVLVYNLLIIAGLALSGWSMYLLMRRWTGSEWAGIVAGTDLRVQRARADALRAPAGAARRVLSADALRARSRASSDAGVAETWRCSPAAFVLQALCSNYLLVFTTYAIVVAVLGPMRRSSTAGKSAGAR